LAQLFVISNRVASPLRDGGKRAGGLEVAIRATMKQHPGIWFGWSGNTAPGGAVQTRFFENAGLRCLVTDLTEEDYQEYYNGFANRVLWPILHYRLDLAEFSRRDLSGYMRVNERFADELHRHLQPGDVVWVHDYHLLPLAKALRERGHSNKIGLFLHIPIPPPEILTALPNHDRLIPAICYYDLLGFQTEVDAGNCARYLAGECRLPNYDQRSFIVGDRTVRLGVFPVGIETPEFNRMARRAKHSSFVRRAIESLAGIPIIGVDRLDYSKGIALRMDAFERFLATNADWRGKVTYLQVTPRSRSEIKAYAEMERPIDALVGRINGAFGEVSWTPIRYIKRTHSRTALAGLYRSARVGLVTPLRDGMNLVAKEYVAAQDADDPGVLILSRFAGAATELEAALLVNPYDPEAVAAAIARALSMPLDERRARHDAMFRVLSENTITDWAKRFLEALTRPPSGSLFRPRPMGLVPREFSALLREKAEDGSQKYYTNDRIADGGRQFSQFLMPG
jgi:trehalose 6-phosphate synthase